MKLPLFTALLALTATPALAQTAAPAAPAADATATAAAKFSLDTPIETIVADAAAKAVLDADLPGVSTHPAFDQFKAMSLTQVQPLSQGAITDEALAKVKADLAVIK